MFRCKQFAVQQDKCAMKVSTDSLLLGSWCQPTTANAILDIGTGTGILSLMMAQKSQSACQITAIEIDEAAAQQAKANFNASPWPDKFTLINTDFAIWWQQNSQQFDLILANPPWFEYAPSPAHNANNQLRDAQRTVARQQSQLDLESLFQSAGTLMAPQGCFYLVMPASAESQIKVLSDRFHFVQRARLDVKATSTKAPYCQLWHLGRSALPLNEEHDTQSAEEGGCGRASQEIVIRDNQGHYTDAYKALCSDFYLNF